jgi:hypothetical protein
MEDEKSKVLNTLTRVTKIIIKVGVGISLCYGDVVSAGSLLLLIEMMNIIQEFYKLQ